MKEETERIPDAHDARERVRRERNECQQRLSDLATAVHDWAEAHGYLDIPPAKRYAYHESDRKLLDAYRRSQD